MNRCLAEATPSVVALALIAGSLSGVLPGMPLHADPLIGTAADWRAYHGSPDQAHYSHLAQISRDNVGQLEVAWTFDTGDAFPGSQMQCNPLVVDGALYATTPKLRVIALDAATGQLRWHFDPLGDRPALGLMRNRGLAWWADGEDRRLFVAVRQYLYALDARSGRPIASFGSDGRIDLRDGLGRDIDGLAVSLSTPGIVYEDLLIIGSVVSEVLPAAPGDVRAIDVRSGKTRWTFHTIPAAGEPGAETWPADARQRSGGANNWAGMALDARRGIVYVPTGSATYDFYGADRPGNNLYANSLIALDAATGRRLWHYQFVRHDLWDRDLPAPPTLVTVHRAGKPVDAVAQVTKSGHVFLFNRVNGSPLFPIEERRVPASEIPGEQAATTQPVPLVPEPFARQRLTEALLTQRTSAAHAAAVERFRTLRSDGQFTPGSFAGTVMFPGFDGGAEWGGAAVDPRTGILYVNSNEMAWILRIIERPSGREASGPAIYLAECAGCHGADRAGEPPHMPSLIGLGDRYTDTEIFTFLLQGGARMPGFAHLGWPRLLAVSDYILHGRDAAVSEPADDAPSPSSRYMSNGFVKFLDADGYPAIEPPWGTLNAIDLNTGRYLWRVPLGEYRALAAQGLSGTGSENYGGPVVTAGGVLFIGATVHDSRFRAIDIDSGRVLWQTTLPAAGHATPAVYEVAGREFVVIAAGGGKNRAAPSGGTYVAFALPAAPPAAGD